MRRIFRGLVLRGRVFVLPAACVGLSGALLLGAGCATQKGASASTLSKRVDAPYELASDDDLHELRAEFDALAPGDASRAKRRQALASEYQRRIDRALARQERERAYGTFVDLLGLWSTEELQAGSPALAPYREQALALKAVFARSGSDLETMTALLALTLMDPANARSYEQEIEDVLAYGDELNMASYGPAAKRARPIQVLEVATDALPLRPYVDRLLALYRERQTSLNTLFRQKGTDTLRILGVHGHGVLRTTQNIVRILARSGRLDEAPAQLASVEGIGDDSKLRRLLTAALASKGARPWRTLSDHLLEEGEDLDAATAICAEAVSRFPTDSEAHLCMAGCAEEHGQVQLAIRHYEASLRIEPKQLEPSNHLARLYEIRVSTLAFSDRPRAAEQALSRFESFYHRANARLGTTLEPDLASVYAAMAHGLISLGDLDSASHYLGKSLDLRESHNSLEYLGKIALSQDRHQEALGYFKRALALEEGGFDGLTQRIKIMRLAGQAERGAGNDEAALQHFHNALANWLRIRVEYDVSEAFLSEALIEIGKLEILLGRTDEGVSSFYEALEAYDESSSSHADVIAFLVTNEAFDHARDLYLDALGSDKVDEYFKIYMSLWVLAEAKHTGTEADPLARDFLSSRDGELWHELLARYAVGLEKLETLEAKARSRGQRAEALYYRAVLHPESSNPQDIERMLKEVVRSNMVLFFEYEMAKRRLSKLKNGP